MTNTIICRKIDAEEFERFAEHARNGNFQQSEGMRRLSNLRGRKTDQLGVYEDGILVSAVQIAYSHSRLGWTGSIWLGPIGSLEPRILKPLTDGIRRAARRRGAYMVEAWPPEVLQRHDSNGKPVGERNTSLIDGFTALGWRHGQLGTGYGEVVNRWDYVKDLTGIHDRDGLMRSFEPRMRTCIRKAGSMGVKVREIGVDELSVFADIERETADRRGFRVQGERYFRQFRKAFGDRAHFMLAEIDTDAFVSSAETAVESLEERIGKLERKAESHPSSKVARQLRELGSNRQAALRRLEQARSLAGAAPLIPVASSLFVEHPNEVVYLFSGSRGEYKSFYAPALIQLEAMDRFCLRTGVNRYNFYGITGVFDDSGDEGRGVLEFKQGFNGFVEELSGGFVLPVRPFRFLIHSVWAGSLWRRG
ncbi:peptidoglycan bridge formation glycyltransferase FemA/FemB family protein [Bifidobacterium callitrichidarum]|nr:peptidoglycan bridge formation glycyltransferase FemA/FemB family protein [Bifidobacterium callitrichidarum]